MPSNFDKFSQPSPTPDMAKQALVEKMAKELAEELEKLAAKLTEGQTAELAARLPSNGQFARFSPSNPTPDRADQALAEELASRLPPNGMLVGLTPYQAGQVIADYLDKQIYGRKGPELTEALAAPLRVRSWPALDSALTRLASIFQAIQEARDEFKDAPETCDCFRFQIQALRKRFVGKQRSSEPGRLTKLAKQRAKKPQKPTPQGQCSLCWRTVPKPSTKPTVCRYHDLPATHRDRVWRTRMVNKAELFYRKICSATPNYKDLQRCGGDVEQEIVALATGSSFPQVAEFLGGHAESLLDICNRLEIWPEANSFNGKKYNFLGLVQIYEGIRRAEAWLQIEMQRKPRRPRKNP